MKIKILTDSSSSLTLEECEKMGIDCVELQYMVDGENHNAFDNPNETLADFYKLIDAAKSCSTGCGNEYQFEQHFEKWIEKGYQVVYMGLSAALSSTFNNAVSVANRLNEKYGKKVAACVNTKTGSYGILLFIEDALQMIKDGKTLDEIVAKLSYDGEKMIETSFVPRDLSFLYKCGRIGTLEASIGKLLHIVPIVSPVQPTGKLSTTEKCLGSKLAMKTLKNKYVKLIKSKGLTKCAITSCGLDKDAEDLKNHIIENTDIKDIKIGLIDKTLACCCGPKTLAIFCK